MTCRALTVAAIAACCGASGVVRADTSGAQLAEGAGRKLIGTPAPLLVLKTIDGESIDLGRLYGRKAVYLKFWATWCVPCRQQMPHFERTYEQAGNDLVVIAVNAGFNDSIEDVKAYRRDVGLRMPIVIDDGRLADALHLRVTPQHIVIGRDGRIDYIGHLVDERLEASLKAARAQPFSLVGRSSPLVAKPSYQIGEGVEAVTLRMLDGQETTLRDPAATRPTVIMFLSPWCESYYQESRPARAAACRRAREQSERLAAKSETRWIGIASGIWATASDLEQYRGENRVTVPLSLDETGTLFRRFGVKDVPTFIVLDRKGTVAGRVDEVTDHLAEQLSAAERSPGS